MGRDFVAAGRSAGRNQPVEMSGWDSVGGAMAIAPLNWGADRALISLSAAADGSWYAVQTRVRFEKKVAEQLRRKGIDVFLPLLKQVRRWSDRRQVIEAPLFPGYGFVHVHLDPAVRLRVLQTAGLIAFVAFHGEAIPVPAKQIEDIQRLLAQDVPCSMYPFLKAGRRVRLRGGCLEGVEGILTDCRDRHLLITVEAIQRTIAISVEGYEVELL